MSWTKTPPTAEAYYWTRYEPAGYAGRFLYEVAGNLYLARVGQRWELMGVKALRSDEEMLAEGREWWDQPIAVPQ